MAEKLSEGGLLYLKFMTENQERLRNNHPCFASKPGNLGRIHLPVSPACNIGCRFCSRVLNDTENRVINKQFTVVADAQYALGITKFLVNDLGLIPAKQFVTDDTPKEHQELIAAEFQSLNYGIKADVAFETDGFKIHEEIKSHDYHGYPLVLGGYYEKEVTEKLKGNFLNISWPVMDKVVFDDFYVGYTGGIRLIEDIYTVAVQRFN